MEMTMSEMTPEDVRDLWIRDLFNDAQLDVTELRLLSDEEIGDIAWAKELRKMRFATLERDDDYDSRRDDYRDEDLG